MAMRILMVNKTDQAGGAARSAMRLHQGLRRCGYDSWLLVDEKVGNDPYTIVPEGWFARKRQVFAARLERKAERVLNQSGRHHVLSQGIGTDVLLDAIKKLKPDVVHLHWINRGQVSIKTLKQIKVPIIWTMHDAWAVTGNCHYPGSCTRYVGQCGACPQHGSKHELDTSREVWLSKRKEWSGLKLSLVAPSIWLADLAKQSSLVQQLGLSVSRISYGLDTDIFVPQDKAKCRQQLGLPQGVPLLLFGAVGGTDDPRKGSQHLIKALRDHKQWMPANLELVIFGAEATEKLPIDYPIHYLGKLTTDAALAQAYNAATAFVAPSEEDNLPNTILESLSCGTPVAGFDIGGLPDVIIPAQTGFLAPPLAADGLAKAIVLTLAKAEEMSPIARAFAVKELGLVRQAEMYYRLYNAVLYNY
jgi:glycosyltransferase involved in cell wall biosynthesis